MAGLSRLRSASTGIDGAKVPQARRRLKVKFCFALFHPLNLRAEPLPDV